MTPQQMRNYIHTLSPSQKSSLLNTIGAQCTYNTMVGKKYSRVLATFAIGTLQGQHQVNPHARRGFHRNGTVRIVT